MLAIPPPTPVRIPVAEPTVATDVLLLAHVPPPAVESVRVVPEPVHRVAVLLTSGMGFTVTTAVV